MKGKFNKVIKGSFFLGFGAFSAKLLGAIYRIPLTGLLGGYGIGLYQMVFPMYSLLLDFSGAGAPNAISKLIAQNNNKEVSYKYLRVSIRLFSLLGLLSGIIMAFLSRILSSLQGNVDAFYAYISLSPAVFFVCLLSSFRGYFQGEMNMIPTALSQIIEQVVKLSLGLLFCKLFLPNVPLAVAGATLSITISEIVAFIYVFITFKVKNKGVKLSLFKKNGERYFSGAKTLLKTVIPITLIGVILPLSQVFDSFITINILKKYVNNATTLYGLFSGVVLTVIHLPVSICYGIASSIIPALSGAKSIDEKKADVTKSIIFTLVLSLSASLLCFSFSNPILKLLFGRLSDNERELSVNLLKISSISIVFHALLQTVNGVLIAENKTLLATFGMILGVIFKFVLSLTLVSNPNINIYGSAISSIACYFIAFLVNFIIVIKKVYVNADKKSFASRQINFQ